MLNVAIIMGRLTRDPELRRTNSGKPVASFTVAVDRDFAPEGQEKQTDFIDCVAWQGTAEFVEKYFKKGSMIVVDGRLQLQDWTDKDGNKRRTAEIVASNVYFGESKRDKEGSNQGYNQNSYPGGAGGAAGYQQPQQGYQPQYGGPQYNQQGFGGYQQQGFSGYQQQGFQGQVYHPPQGAYAPIEGDDPKLPF